MGALDPAWAASPTYYISSIQFPNKIWRKLIYRFYKWNFFLKLKEIKKKKKVVIFNLRLHLIKKKKKLEIAFDKIK
jgi:tyrosyl-tRNA synthetase